MHIGDRKLRKKEFYKMFSSSILGHLKLIGPEYILCGPLYSILGPIVTIQYRCDASRDVI